MHNQSYFKVILLTWLGTGPVAWILSWLLYLLAPSYTESLGLTGLRILWVNGLWAGLVPLIMYRRLGSQSAKPPFIILASLVAGLVAYTLTSFSLDGPAHALWFGPSFTFSSDTHIRLIMSVTATCLWLLTLWPLSRGRGHRANGKLPD